MLSAFVIGQEHAIGPYLAERSRYVLQSFLRTPFRKLHVLGMNRHLWDSSPRRRLSRSAKVSSARATGLSHLSSQKGSDLGQETFFLDQWSLWVSVCGVVDLEVKLGVRCRATHRSGLIHVSLILDNVSIADARFAGFPSGIIR